MSQLRFRRIVLLDDHKGSRFVTRYLLVLLGHDCKAVESTEAALTAIDTFKPDLIIYEWYARCDVRLGLSVRLRARAAAYRAVPAVIILSALDEPAGFREHEAIDAYLTKPIGPSELEAALRACA